MLSYSGILLDIKGGQNIAMYVPYAFYNELAQNHTVANGQTEAKKRELSRISLIM